MTIVGPDVLATVPERLERDGVAVVPGVLTAEEAAALSRAVGGGAGERRSRHPGAHRRRSIQTTATSGCST